MTARRRYRTHRGRGALEAIASPARQELLLALGEGHASVRELAVRLGRSRSALHYHAGLLERAGMIESVGVRGTGRARETIYARTSEGLTVNAKPTLTELDVAKRAGQALLRLTGRELVRALGEVRANAGVPRAPFGARGKARLTREKLARANTLIDELLGLFADAPSARPQTGQLYAITVVLTPSRDASAHAGSRRRAR